MVLVVKNAPANPLDLRDVNSISGSWRSGHCNPLQYAYWRIPWAEELTGHRDLAHTHSKNSLLLMRDTHPKS